jgi:hypothetical protein
MAFINILERDPSDNKIKCVEASTYDSDLKWVTNYTKERGNRIARVLNAIEKRHPGLTFGLPNECTAYREYCGGVGHAVLNTENFENSMYLDYYGNYWGVDSLNEMLEKADLYSEWNNCAVSAIFTI